MIELRAPFEGLTPDTVVSAVESLGLLSDLRIFPLNSYENRVYQVGLEDQRPVIAKFYRPQRWSDEQIQEEHDFTRELQAMEIPAVTPLVHNRQTLHQFQDFRFALYPREGGSPPDFDNLDHLLVIGRTLGRLHLIGQQQPFQHRPAFDLENYATRSMQYLLENDFIPADLRIPYESLCRDLIQRMQDRWNAAGQVKFLRIHGDCHVGNILWRDEMPRFVDFDDCMTGPAVQDLWLFLSGTRVQQQIQLGELLEGYNDFMEFNAAELHLTEVLRTARIMHYSAWLARRWQDPAFPHHFPWFNTDRYWSEHILELREQLAALDEPPLEIY